MDNDAVDPLQIKIEIARRKLPLDTVNAIDAVDWRAAILELRNKRGFTFEQLGKLEIETELVLCGLLNPKDYPKEVEKRMEIGRAQANEVVNEMNEMVFKKIREEFIKNTERKKIFANKENQSTSSQPSQPLQTSPYHGRQTIPLDKGEYKGVKGEVVSSSVPPAKPELGNPPNGNGTRIFKNAGIEFLEATPELPNGNKPMEGRENILEKVENPDSVHPIAMQKLSGATQTKVVETEHTLGNISKVAGTNEGAGSAPKTDPYREIPT